MRYNIFKRHTNSTLEPPGCYMKSCDRKLLVTRVVWNPFCWL